MKNIEVVDASNFPLVLPLVCEYQKFYGAVPNTQLNEVFFRRFIDCHDDGIQFIALDEQGRAVGFATVLWQISTLSAGRRCILNDLYTVEQFRGKGVARALIAHASSYARCCGAHCLEWQTQFANETAQHLYDQLPAHKTAWYSYTLPI